MAKSKSSKTLPPREVITKRVETQRRRVWQAQAVCSITSQAAAVLVGGGSEAARFAESAWVALEGMAELLDSTAGKLDGDAVLAPAEPGEEDAS
jgi:hypothetical protein